MDKKVKVNASILIIGNEILSGRTQDTNTSTLAIWLNSIGVNVAEVRVLPDADDIIVDTKSTLRLPTAPKVDHIRQQALYSTLHKKKIALLYATPKKSLWYELSDDDVKDGYAETINDFKSLENYIIMSKNN